MRTANLTLSEKSGLHLNASLRRVPESPLFLLPTLFFIPKHDVSLEIEGIGLGGCFLRFVFQINLRRSSWARRSSAMTLARATALARRMRSADPSVARPPDPLSIIKSVAAAPHLGDICSRGGDESHYGLLILRAAAQEEMAAREPRQGGSAAPKAPTAASSRAR